MQAAAGAAAVRILWEAAPALARSLVVPCSVSHSEGTSPCFPRRPRPRLDCSDLLSLGTTSQWSVGGESFCCVFFPAVFFRHMKEVYRSTVTYSSTRSTNEIAIPDRNRLVAGEKPELWTVRTLDRDHTSDRQMAIYRTYS